ncbi:HNH endonuclease [Henriciella aquimarina]|uniref:HNH endonuclease n=1 Tax=Henriciella aquimarina TaxID=545261 RepID=UPI001301C8F7|nr:HNH endonuclease [Henriciella aquimarina]
MARRPDWIKDRKPFSEAVKRAVQERSGGTCEKLGCEAEGEEYDHGVPVALGGESTLENCRLLCTACHRRKSSLDVKMIARADRKGGRSGQYARRTKAKAEGRHKAIPSRKNPWPKGRKLQSRSTWK